MSVFGAKGHFQSGHPAVFPQSLQQAHEIGIGDPLLIHGPPPQHFLAGKPGHAQRLGIDIHKGGVGQVDDRHQDRGILEDLLTLRPAFAQRLGRPLARGDVLQGGLQKLALAGSETHQMHFRIPDLPVGMLVAPLKHHLALGQRLLDVLAGLFRGGGAVVLRRGRNL